MKRAIPKGRILVSDFKEESKIFIQQNQTRAKVEIGGKEVDDGDTVVYFKNPTANSRLRRPVRVMLDDKEYFLLRESDIVYIE